MKNPASQKGLLGSHRLLHQCTIDQFVQSLVGSLQEANDISLIRTSGRWYRPDAAQWNLSNSFPQFCERILRWIFQVKFFASIGGHAQNPPMDHSSSRGAMSGRPSSCK